MQIKSEKSLNLGDFSSFVHPLYILRTSYICPSLLLFDAGILLDRLRGDGRGVLGGVRDLRVRCGGGDRAPSLTARHSQRYCATRQQR